MTHTVTIKHAIFAEFSWKCRSFKTPRHPSHFFSALPTYGISVGRIDQFFDSFIWCFEGQDFVGLLLVEIQPFAKGGIDLTFGAFSLGAKADHGSFAIRFVEVDYVVATVIPELRRLLNTCHLTLLSA
jgi:hypothetical protein